MGLVAPWHVGSSGPGVEPMSPTVAGGFLATGPPGKSHVHLYLSIPLTAHHLPSLLAPPSFLLPLHFLISFLPSNLTH